MNAVSLACTFGCASRLWAEMVGEFFVHRSLPTASVPTRRTPAVSGIRKTYRELFSLALVVLLSLPCAAQTVYDVAADFSATSNPAGAWSYGYAHVPTDPFNLFTREALYGQSPNSIPSWDRPMDFPASYPRVFKNNTDTPLELTPGDPTQTIPANAFGMHPGVQLSDYPYAITRLTLPTAGDYVLNATFTALETDANTIDTWILIKGTSGNVLFNVALANDGVVSGYGGTISVSNYEFSAAVGTTVDFVVGPKYNWIGDTTGLAATVTAIPEPSTYAALLGLAALGYALLTRRRGRHPSSALAEPIFRETRNPRIK